MSTSDSTRVKRIKKITIYDTTLRDGSQLEGISLTVEDKLRIAEQLDYWASTTSRRLARRQPEGRRVLPARRAELKLDTSTLVAFGSTRRVKGKVDDDPTLRNLVEAGTSAVASSAKAGTTT
jgi:2-isopropylmalate synthase